jgi:hypothetical protein
MHLAADAASLNIVEVMHTQVIIIHYLVYRELLICILGCHLSDTEGLRGWKDVHAICRSLRVTASSVSE